MKAILHDAYGPPEVLTLAEVPKPVVEDGEVLVRVHAASVNPADWHLMRGDPYIARLSFGPRKPRDRVPGCDLAGRVEAVGSNVTTVQPGDEVFGSPFEHGLGAFAEFAAISADLVAPRPANLTLEQAATVPVAAMTALQGLRDHGRVEAGQKVLIIGASGGVGTFAVQIAKSLGAEVTGACSAAKSELVRSVGADHVIDYAEEDFTAGAERYDVIFQLGGTRSPSDCRRALTSNGTLVLSSGEPAGRLFGPLGRVVKAMVVSPFVSERMVTFTVKPNREDLLALKELIEAGTVTPVIDRTYSLSEVPDAVGYLEEGNARGKVGVKIWRATAESPSSSRPA
jgi:NADPH:quinone reductase-like Zn-dependent oxidoreductase